MDILLTMAYPHLDAEFAVDVFRKMLCRIHTAMLATSASEGKHQAGKPTLDIAGHMCIGKSVDTIEECEDFTIIFQEAYDRLIQSGEFLIWLISSGVVRATTVEDISAAVARFILGDTFSVGEAIYPYHQWAFAIIF